jgi:thioredoxin-like negative regulator of GroEL
VIAQDPNATAADRDEATKRLAELRLSGQLAAADLALDNHKLDEAKRILSELSLEDQKSPEARIMEAKVKLLGGDAAAGEAELQQISADLNVAPEVREEAKATLAEVRINQLMKSGEGAFDQGNHKLALSLSEEVYGLAPERTDVVQFRARTLLKNNQADAALQLLEKCPADKNAEGSCDHSRLLAVALEQSNCYVRAIGAYRELATNPKLSLLERSDALDSAETLAAFASPRSAVDWRFIDAEEGRWNEVRVNFQSGILSHGLQFIGEGFWDAIAPSDGARFSGKTEADLLEASGSLRAYFSGNRFVQGGLTGHQDGVGFGVSAGQIPLQGPGYQLRYDYQQRATYSQALRSLNGRQNKVSGTLQTELGAGVSLDAMVGWRNVFVDHESLGNGFAFELALMKTILKETASMPGLTLAYLGEWSRLSQNNTVEVRRAIGVDPNDPTDRLAELVDPRINRHEAQLSLVRHWTERFQSTLTGAIGYEFEDEQSVWRLGLQLAYRFRPNLKLTLQGDYDSSGQGSNSGSAMQSIWLGLAMDY